VERMFSLLQQDLKRPAAWPGPGRGSLEELNGKLACWLQEVTTRACRWQSVKVPRNASRVLYRCCGPWIRIWIWIGLFYTRIDRVVRKDGRFASNNDLYELNLALRGLKVQLELDPWINKTRSWSATRGRTSDGPQSQPPPQQSTPWREVPR